MQSKAKTVKAYLAELPADRRVAIETVRREIRANLPKGYEEMMQYGMISYAVPLKLYPKGYAHDGKTPLPFVGLANQKNYMALYLMCVYGNDKLATWFTKEYKASGKKLDMGKGCVRFKTLNDLPVEVIGKTVAKVPVDKFIRIYDDARRQMKRG